MASSSEKPGSKVEAEEYPDSWWHKVYFVVIVVTILVIAALWGFSKYFS